MPYTLLAICLMLFAPLLPLQGDELKESPEADLLPLEPVAPQAKTAVSPFVMPPMLLPVPPAETPEAPSATQPILRTVKAYYVPYADDSFEAVRRYVGAVDIIAGQWLAVDGNGNLKEAPDFQRNDEVRQIVHAAGKKVYSCVINRDFDRAVLSSILSTAARRTAAIDRIVAFVEKKGDDGVDLDFEGVRAGHRHGYHAFVKELAEKLHARGKELSIALDVTWEGAPSPGLDYDLLAQHADSLMPMTYTFGPGRTPHSPIHYLESAARTAMRSMDPSKFMIGIGVYGRDYDLKTGKRTHPNAARLQAILAQYNPRVIFDEETLTKRLAYKDSSGHSHLVHFDDSETIRAKLTRLAEKYGVCSVGFWRMGQEDASLWDVIDIATGRSRPAQTASRP